MSRSTLLALAPLLALVVVACRTPGGPQTPASVPSPTPVTTAAPEPTASPSPPPTASPSPRPSPTPSPSPSPTLDPAAVAAWVQEVCAINADLVTGTQQVIEQLPEPDDPTLAQLQATNEQRRPMIESLLADTAGRLHGVEQLDGGESFHDALRAELADRLAAAGQFFDAVAAAQTIEQYDAAVLVQAAAAQEATFRTARSVLELEPARRRRAGPDRRLPCLRARRPRPGPWPAAARLQQAARRRRPRRRCLDAAGVRWRHGRPGWRRHRVHVRRPS